jgi:hypothetical protein
MLTFPEIIFSDKSLLHQPNFFILQLSYFWRRCNIKSQREESSVKQHQPAIDQGEALEIDKDGIKGAPIYGII